MKPIVAADEMFPEGVGTYMDLEEGVGSSAPCVLASICYCAHLDAAKRLSGGPSNLLMDLAANEKAVHADFFNDFEDLFDDDDLK